MSMLLARLQVAGERLQRRAFGDLGDRIARAASERDALAAAMARHPAGRARIDAECLAVEEAAALIKSGIDIGCRKAAELFPQHTKTSAPPVTGADRPAPATSPQTQAGAGHSTVRLAEVEYVPRTDDEPMSVLLTDAAAALNTAMVFDPRQNWTALIGRLRSSADEFKRIEDE